MPQLAPRLEHRPCLSHAVNRLAAKIKLAVLISWPINFQTDETLLELLEIQVPLTSLVLDIDAVLSVDLRHQCVTHERPGFFVLQQTKLFHVYRNAPVLHGGAHGDELPPMQRGLQVNMGQ